MSLGCEQQENMPVNFVWFRPSFTTTGHTH